MDLLALAHLYLEVVMRRKASAIDSEPLADTNLVLCSINTAEDSESHDKYLLRVS